jgi:hypothetical protein
MEHLTAASPRQLPTTAGGRSLVNVPHVSTFRLYLLRAMYVFMFVGLAIVKWPAILNPPPGLSNAGSVVGSVLLAISLLALLGVRYPVKMLPLLCFEFLWKFIWVLGWGLPPLLTEQLTPEAEQMLISCLVGVVLVPLVMPWGYLFKQYVKAPGDAWGKHVTVMSSRQAASSPRAQA